MEKLKTLIRKFKIIDSHNTKERPILCNRNSKMNKKLSYIYFK